MSIDTDEAIWRELAKDGNATIDPATGKVWKYAIALSDRGFLKALQSQAWRFHNIKPSTPPKTPTNHKSVREATMAMSEEAFAKAIRDRSYLSDR